MGWLSGQPDVAVPGAVLGVVSKDDLLLAGSRGFVEPIAAPPAERSRAGRWNWLAHSGICVGLGHADDRAPLGRNGV